jgi:hypothetical protein
MKGSVILLEANPKGKFIEGTIYGTPYPGTLMTVKAATEPGDGDGRHTWEPYNTDANGTRQIIAVLLPPFGGGAYNTIFVSGQRCQMYCPVPGEELNVLVSASGTGTGDSIAIGQLLIPVDGTGLLIATTGTPEIEPFLSLETQTDVVAAGTLTHCMYTGH